MTRTLAFLALLAAGCVVDAPSNSADDCREFDHRTTHHGKTVVCRVLWCNRGALDYATGGPATLWCDEVTP